MPDLNKFASLEARSSDDGDELLSASMINPRSSEIFGDNGFRRAGSLKSSKEVV